MRKPVVLITGAGGEIGHGLMAGLAGPSRSIITLDVTPLDKALGADGRPSLAAKTAAGRVQEDHYLNPTTMYGCNKLYCEQLGGYYARHYKQLAADAASRRVDFRCVRFPGLISAVTVPSGGTSDYAPEMIHAAARGEPYACFVRPDTTIPFMAMPDAIDALLQLSAVPVGRLTCTAYNVKAFNP